MEVRNFEIKVSLVGQEPKTFLNKDFSNKTKFYSSDKIIVCIVNKRSSNLELGKAICYLKVVEIFLYTFLSVRKKVWYSKNNSAQFKCLKLWLDNVVPI